MDAKLWLSQTGAMCVGTKMKPYLHRRHLAVRQSAKIRGGPSQKIVRLRPNRRLRVELENVRERRRYIYLLSAVNPLVQLTFWHFAHGAEEREWRPRQAEVTRDERDATRYRAIRFIRGVIRQFHFDRYFEGQCPAKLQVDTRIYKFKTAIFLWLKKKKKIFFQSHIYVFVYKLFHVKDI